MTLRRVGIGAVALGWIVSLAAYLAHVPTGPVGIVFPIAMGFLIVLLGDLAIAWSYPAETRPSFLRSSIGVVAIGVWSTAGVIVLATWPESRLVFAPLTWLPRPLAEVVTVIVATTLFAGGVLVTTLGALYSLGYLLLTTVHHLTRWASTRGQP
jgi:hypothetical protein